MFRDNGSLLIIVCIIPLISFSNSRIYTLEFNMRPGITEFETIIELYENVEVNVVDDSLFKLIMEI